MGGKKRVTQPYDGALGRFGKYVAKLSADVIATSAKDKARQKEIKEAIDNVFHDRPGPRHATPRAHTPAEDLAMELFSGFVEISAAIEALEASIVFLPCYQSCPRRVRIKISRTDYQRYHIEKWLSETYILRERIRTFFTKLSRRLRQYQDLKRRLEACLAVVDPAFDQVTNARSHHIHQSRYRNDAIDRMQLVEFYGSIIKKRAWKVIFVEEYFKESERKALAGVKTNTEFLKAAVDMFFDQITPFIFDARGRLIVNSGGAGNHVLQPRRQ